jgi:hypothetical protein
MMRSIKSNLERETRPVYPTRTLMRLFAYIDVIQKIRRLRLSDLLNVSIEPFYIRNTRPTPRLAKMLICCLSFL